MGALVVVLISWPLASVVVALAVGVTIRLRDRQVPTVAAEPPPQQRRTIVIPEPRSACRAETEARIPSR